MAIKYDSNFTEGDLLPSSVVNNIIDSIKENEINIGKKIDKVDGKGLSSNDYTNEEKQKNADNESHIGNLSELSKSMFGSSPVDAPKSLVDAINIIVDVVRNKVDADYVGIQKVENKNNSEAIPWGLQYMGLYYFKGKFSLPTSQGSYTYKFDNLVYVENDGVQNYQLTVYEQTGVTILAFGNDSTEIEKKTYSYDQFVQKTDYASEDKAGIVQIDIKRGIGIVPTDHKLYVNTLIATDIKDRTDTIGVLTMALLNHAVKAALTDDKRITDMTEPEKINARGVIGAESKPYIMYHANPGGVSLHDREDHRISSNVTPITLVVPSSIGADYECCFSFQSGETATTLTYPGDTIKFVGVDCDESGDFIPTTNRNYEVIIKNLATDGATPVLVARVGVY